MCGKAPFHFEPGLQQFEACSSHVCVPSNWCNFDLRNEIEGFISTYIMTEKYSSAHFPLQQCSLLFSVQSSVHTSVPVPLVIPCIYTHWCSVQDPGEQEPEGRLVQVQAHIVGERESQHYSREFI